MEENIDILKHEYSLIYNSYLIQKERKESIIQQASRMQANFSFVIASLFLLLSIIVPNINNLSIGFIVLAFSSTSIMLFASLIMATFTQSRMKEIILSSSKEIIEIVAINSDALIDEGDRVNHLISNYSTMEEKLRINNSKRIKYLNASMILFYISIFMFIGWFIIGVVKVI